MGGACIRCMDKEEGAGTGACSCGFVGSCGQWPEAGGLPLNAYCMHGDRGACTLVAMPRVGVVPGVGAWGGRAEGEPCGS